MGQKSLFNIPRSKNGEEAVENLPQIKIIMHRMCLMFLNFIFQWDGVGSPILDDTLSYVYANMQTFMGPKCWPPHSWISTPHIR